MSEVFGNRGTSASSDLERGVQEPLVEAIAIPDLESSCNSRRIRDQYIVYLYFKVRKVKIGCGE